MSEIKNESELLTILDDCCEDNSQYMLPNLKDIATRGRHVQLFTSFGNFFQKVTPLEGYELCDVCDGTMFVYSKYCKKCCPNEEYHLFAGMQLLTIVNKK